MITELKRKEKRLGAIITWARTQEEIDSANKMGAASAHVQSHILTKGLIGKSTHPGVKFIYWDRIPHLSDALGHYLSSVRSSNAVLVASPELILAEDFTSLYEHANAGMMQRTYGFKYKHSAAGFTGNVIEYVFHAAKKEKQLNPEQWLDFVNAWSSKGIPTHRMFSLEPLNLISEKPQPEPEPVVAEESKVEVRKPKKGKK